MLHPPHRPLATSTRSNAVAAHAPAPVAAAPAAPGAHDLAKSDHPPHAHHPMPADPAARHGETALIDAVRNWRDDSLALGFLGTAAHWAETALSISGSLADAYDLAHIYFKDGEYQRAILLLQRFHLHEASLWGKCLFAQCRLQLHQYEAASRDLAKEFILSRTRGDQPLFKELDTRLTLSRGRSLSVEALLWFQRGIALLELVDTCEAKKALRRAIDADMRCIQAFDALVQYSLLTRTETLELLGSLKVRAGDRLDRRLVHVLYQARAAQADHTLATPVATCAAATAVHPGLPACSDFRLLEAHSRFIRANFEHAHEITSLVLASDPYNSSCLPLHIACLYETQRKNDLFILSHQLFERFPKSHLPHFAVGVYYMATGKHQQSHDYFNKVTSIKSDFAPAWIANGHAFSLDGEHEQAIAAYSNVVRTYPNLHLSKMFIGMEYMVINNLTLAKEYLEAASQLCNTDPLLLNELGVLYYRRGDYTRSLQYLDRASQHIDQLRAPLAFWNTIFINIGHAYRAQGRYDLACKAYEHVMANSPLNAQACSALGFVQHILGHLDRAIDLYHKALSIDVGDMLTSNLLEKALMEASMQMGDNGVLKHMMGMDDDKLNDAVEEMLSKQDGVVEEMDGDGYDVVAQQGFVRRFVGVDDGEHGREHHDVDGVDQEDGSSRFDEHGGGFRPRDGNGGFVDATSSPTGDASAVPSGSSGEAFMVHVDDANSTAAPSSRPRTRLAVQRGLRSPYNCDDTGQTGRTVHSATRGFERVRPRRGLENSMPAGSVSVTHVESGVSAATDAGIDSSTSTPRTTVTVAESSGAFAPVAGTAAARVHALRNRKSVSTDDGMSPLVMPSLHGDLTDDARPRVIATHMPFPPAPAAAESLDYTDRSSSQHDTATPPPHLSSRYRNFNYSVSTFMAVSDANDLVSHLDADSIASSVSPTDADYTRRMHDVFHGERMHRGHYDRHDAYGHGRRGYGDDYGVDRVVDGGDHAHMDVDNVGASHRVASVSGPSGHATASTIGSRPRRR